MDNTKMTTLGLTSAFSSQWIDCVLIDFSAVPFASRHLTSHLDTPMRSFMGATVLSSTDWLQTVRLFGQADILVPKMLSLPG